MNSMKIVATTVLIGACAAVLVAYFGWHAPTSHDAQAQSVDVASKSDPTTSHDMDAIHTEEKLAESSKEPKASQVKPTSNVGDKKAAIDKANPAGTNEIFGFVLTNDVETLGVNQIEKEVASISDYLDRNDVVKRLNADEFTKDERARFTQLFDYISKLRTAELNFKAKDLNRELDDYERGKLAHQQAVETEMKAVSAKNKKAMDLEVANYMTKQEQQREADMKRDEALLGENFTEQ